MEHKIGTQVFGLKKEFEENWAGTFETIADIGFQRIEPLVAPVDDQLPFIPVDIWSHELIRKAKPLLKDLGLSMPTMHVCAGLGAQDQPDRLIADQLLRLRDISGATGFVFSGMFKDAEGAKRCGEHLAVIADFVQPEGLTVIYHNHDDEWQMIEDNGEMICGMDDFYRYAGDQVMLEMDIGWTSLVCDEVKAARRYADQIVELHCRDFAGEAYLGTHTRETMPAEYFVPVGTGQVKVRELMEMAKSFPHYSGDYVVEQEKSAHGMLKDMKASFETMKVWLEEDEA